MNPRLGWLFTGLTALMLIAALKPSWRKSCGWGRSGGKPLTAVGWTAWIAALVAIAGFFFGLVPPVAVGAAFIFVIAAAVHDHQQS